MIECFMDRIGNDLKMTQVYSNKIADCINLCDATAGCVDIAMSGTACYMKNKIGTTVNANNGVRGARLVAAAPSSSTSSGSSSVGSTSVSNSTSSAIISSSVGSSSVSTAPSLSANSTSSISVSANSTTSATSVSGSPVVGANATTSSSLLVTTTVIVITSASNSSSTISTGAASSNSSSIAPVTANSTTSAVDATATGTGNSSSIILSTGISSSANVSTTSVDSSTAPYANGTTTTAAVGPTGTGAVATSDPSSTNSTTSSEISANSTSPTVILTTAPLTTAATTANSSTATGVFTNSTTAVNSTTATTTSSVVYPFAAGGIPSGHPLVTNTSACSTPTATASCTRCEGQPGTDQFCGFTAYDNSYEHTPITCDVVHVSLELTECTVAPDGVERTAICVNGITPGPLIEANWGDTIIATVKNSLSKNGTSIHWHGQRQNHTNEMDGVVSVTQCALAPGESMTYTFRASNYGFSWYHSHLTLQAYEGAFGPMWIHGPQTASADVDAGHLIIQDWSHIPVDDMYIDAEINGVRTMDTGLINGLNVFGEGTSSQSGSRYVVPTEFVQGQSYMFNLVNTGIQSSYKFYIDGHNLTVISADFVPIIPYETNVLDINIGQRYQVIVTANQPVGSYWLRFDNQNACATTILSDNIKGIINYAGSSGALPNSTAQTYDRKYAGTNILGSCSDEPLASLVPAYPINVGQVTTTVAETVIVSNANPKNLYRWYLDGTTFQTNWADATLYDIYNNDTIPDYSGNLAIEVPSLNEWVYIIIESPIPLGHPIHLHGHDFHILARGYGTYDSSVELNLVNPPRRDVAFLPGDGPTGQGGFMVLAFLTDNPGVWLMHCHIGWHVAMGFALQFIEAQPLIKDTVSDSCMLNNVCTTWRNHADLNDIITDDSGV